jgi:hypothetical protein
MGTLDAAAGCGVELGLLGDPSADLMLSTHLAVANASVDSGAVWSSAKTL